MLIRGENDRMEMQKIAKAGNTLSSLPKLGISVALITDKRETRGSYFGLYGTLTSLSKKTEVTLYLVIWYEEQL